MEVLLIRHGETEWNRELVFRGRADMPLSERGHEQARLLGEHLAGVKIDAVYSSPLQRAVQTAQPVADGQKIDVVTGEAIVDVDFGKWTGLSRDEVKDKYPESFRKWHSDPLDMIFDSGDSMTQVAKRSREYLNGLVTGDYQRVAVVTHRVIIKMLLVSILEARGKAFWSLQFDTCSISAIEGTGNGWSVKYLNYTDHLKPLSGKSKNGEIQAEDF